MSNRSILADEKLQAEFRQTLEDLVKNIPDNRTCADCGVKGPRWTSTNLGVFICTRCAGIHRSLGTHISKVKSIDLDNWTPEHVETLKRIGNGLAKQVFEHAIPASYRRPATSGHVGTETLELWIRDKYEHKSFTDKQAYNQVYNLGASSTGRPTQSQPQHGHASQHGAHQSHQSHSSHQSHHPSSSHHNTHHAPSHQHRPQQQQQQPKSTELLLDFGTPVTNTTTTTAHTTSAHNSSTNNRGKDFLDTIEFTQFQTATPARPSNTTAPQVSAVQHTAVPSKPNNAQNMQDTKSMLMQLYNTTPNTSTSFAAPTQPINNNNAGHVMNGQPMLVPGQPMMLAPGTMMPGQHTGGMMMMMPGQQGMMMNGQPVMMQGQMMMAPNQPVMYGNQIYYPAQGSMQYPAQSHVTGQYAQNNTSAMFQQPSQFR